MMQTFEFSASDGHSVAAYRWPIENAKAVVQIAHGMGEHAQRYDWVAQQLNAAGFMVFASDHRGHGGTAKVVGGETQWGYMGPDGWNRTLADMYELNQMIRSECSALPLILLGHSMGSMLACQYITRHGASIDALVLSGSPGFKAGFGAHLSRFLSAFEASRLGPEKPSELLQKLMFGNANKPFDGPDASGFEWLSRDPQQVAQYLADEGCGFVLSAGSLVDMSKGIRPAQGLEHLRCVPSTLPIYVLSGVDDPVHSEQQDLNRLLQAFNQAGLSPVMQWYPGGRHEMFNETNREEVLEHLIAWLDSTL